MKTQLRFAIMVLVSILLTDVSTLESAKAQFSMGVKIAGNAVNYKKLTERDFGLEAGVFVRLGTSFFFQPEVNYSFRRSTFLEQYVGYYSSNDALKQHFLSVPVLLGYHFIDHDNFKFRLTLGPRFDFKITNK